MTSLVVNTFSLFGFKNITKWFERLNTYIQRRREISRTVNELQSCTDRELADMGIHRSEIYSVAIGDHARVKTNENLDGWV